MEDQESTSVHVMIMVIKKTWTNDNYYNHYRNLAKRIQRKRKWNESMENEEYDNIIPLESINNDNKKRKLNNGKLKRWHQTKLNVSNKLHHSNNNHYKNENISLYNRYFRKSNVNEYYNQNINISQVTGSIKIINGKIIIKKKD